MLLHSSIKFQALGCRNGALVDRDRQSLNYSGTWLAKPPAATFCLGLGGSAGSAERSRHAAVPRWRAPPGQAGLGPHGHQAPAHPGCRGCLLCLSHGDSITTAGSGRVSLY